MEYPIRFRYLINKLTPTELKSFFSTLIDNENTDFLITSLFNQLLIRSTNKSNECITGITDILNKRKPITNSKTNQTDKDNTPISIECIPSALINNIGSYLYLKDLVKMERINRKFFISLRLPYPALQSIGYDDTLNWMYDYLKRFQAGTKIPDFQQFKSVQKLRVVCSHIKPLTDKYNWNKMIFKKINTLSVIGDCTSKFNYLFQSNIVNFNTIKHLTLSEITSNPDGSAQLFKNMILCSKYIKSLSFKRMTLDNQSPTFESIMNNKDEIRSKLPHLTIFSASDCDLEIYKNVLHSVCDQIESLHIDDENALIKDSFNSNLSFKNVNEFCMVGSRIQIPIAINELLKTVKCLKKINLYIGNDIEN